MKISIITACYNSAATLPDTLDSILLQDYPDYECIVVDGASTDGTQGLLQAYEERFSGKMRWVSKPDKGIYDAMNKALTLATGEVVGFLNSDDFYTSSQTLTHIAKAFATKAIDAVYADVEYVSAKDLRQGVRYYSSRWFRPWTVRFGLMPAHPTFYCKREVYEKLGAFDLSYPIAADFDSLLRFTFLHRIHIQYIPQTLVTMREGGVSNATIESRKQIMRDHLRSLKTHGVYTNRLLLSLRYLYKIGELVYSFYRYHLRPSRQKHN